MCYNFTQEQKKSPLKLELFRIVIMMRDDWLFLHIYKKNQLFYSIEIDFNGNSHTHVFSYVKTIYFFQFDSSVLIQSTEFSQIILVLYKPINQKNKYNQFNTIHFADASKSIYINKIRLPKNHRIQNSS